MILFDFDGVLIDSIDETVYTAYNTAMGALITRAEDLPPGYEALFKRYRYLIQPAGDFPLYAEWCIDHADEPGSIFSLAELKRMREQSGVPLPQRTKDFFLTRARFVAVEPERWLALHRPYQPLWDTLRKRGTEKILVLTNKDREGVSDLFRHFDLAVPGENIYTGDSGTTKSENLVRIRERFPTERFTFLDDSILNLVELSVNPELELLLATWGYLGPDDVALAKKQGIRTVSQEEIVNLT